MEGFTISTGELWFRLNKLFADKYSFLGLIILITATQALIRLAAIAYKALKWLAATSKPLNYELVSTTIIIIILSIPT